MSDDFDKLAPWIAGLAHRLSPREMRQLSRRIGMAMRRVNAQRIAANVQPDGSAMEPRKKRPLRDRKQGRVRKKGRMFPKIRLARNMKLKTDADQAELYFGMKLYKTANVHHFGLRDRVARFRGAPEVRYPERPLLGFAADDEQAIMDAALAHLEKMGR
ncbi:MAG: phage virion morphogenesis protein [Alphaproteobacteria bacterium HGW-Alphaproteobacteria-13]|nr:MAG: phage virion morphogenesis protein [Alphaproteobacteria bacterium HGW-Alphaproteobacteria-13]